MDYRSLDSSLSKQALEQEGPKSIGLKVQVGEAKWLKLSYFYNKKGNSAL